MSTSPPWCSPCSKIAWRRLRPSIGPVLSHQGQGLGLHELVVLAATLEHLIHDEAVQRLSGVYEAQGRELDAVHPVELQDLIDGYMTIYLMGEGTTTKEDTVTCMAL